MATVGRGERGRKSEKRREREGPSRTAFAHSTASPSGDNVAEARAVPGRPTHTKLFMNGRKLSLKLRIE